MIDRQRNNSISGGRNCCADVCLHRGLCVLTAFCVIGLTGCARNTAGQSILNDLRNDGLLNRDDDDEPLPARSVPSVNGDEWSLPTEGEMTLEDLFEAADRLNPQLAAARAQIGVAGGRAWQAGVYPNPSAEIESENVRPSDGGFGASETTVSIAQPIVVGGRLDAGVDAGKAQMNVQRQQLQRLRREVHGRVLRAVTEIAAARQAIALHEKLIDLAQRTLTIAETRFEARAAPESEAIRARVEVNTLGLAIEKLRGDLAAAGERLVALLGGREVEVERVSVDVLDAALNAQLPGLEQLEEAVHASHPELLAARAETEAARRRVTLARARRYPDMTARVGVGINHGDDEGFVQAALGAPLTIFDRNQGNILAARFDVLRARHEAEAAANDLVATLADAYQRWASAVSRLAVFEEQILNGARRSYEQTLAGYQAGRLPFLDLLDAQRTLTQANITQIELARTVSLTLAEILEILGEHPSHFQQTGVTP